jgi:hypothetical protein
MVAKPETTDTLERLLGVAEEQLRWLRAAALPGVRATVEEALTTTQFRRAYELCDGASRNIDIAKAVDASEASVSRWMRRWRDLGIAYEVAGEGGKRNRHLVSLESLGSPVEVPVQAAGASGARR